MKKLLFTFCFILVSCMSAFAADGHHHFTYKSDNEFRGEFFCDQNGILEISKWTFDEIRSGFLGLEIKKVTYFIDEKKIDSNKKEPFGLYYRVGYMTSGLHRFKVKIDYKINGEKWTVSFDYNLYIGQRPTPQKGDTKEYAKRCWGQPDEIRQRPQNTEQWEYKDGRGLIIDENGLVINVFTE